jgi:hypothetical protein
MANNLGLPQDCYWEENEVCFPSAWPETLTLPIAITDTSSLPTQGKFKLLALEEAVLSFWQFVHHCHHVTAESEKECQKHVGEGGGGENSEGPSSASRDTIATKKIEELKQKVERMNEQIERAHRLSRNVTFAIWYVENDKERERKSLDAREQVETLREYLGLAGWNKILVIGRKRDALRYAGLPHHAEAVAAEFSAVVWGPGRAINKPTVEKCLLIYNRFSKEPIVVDIIVLSQSLFGRESPFEEWTKLVIFANSERPTNEGVEHADHCRRADFWKAF